MSWGEIFREFSGVEEAVCLQVVLEQDLWAKEVAETKTKVVKETQSHHFSDTRALEFNTIHRVCTTIRPGSEADCLTRKALLSNAFQHLDF
jgi:hypothetical protein